jgi:hypothetical protein
LALLAVTEDSNLLFRVDKKRGKEFFNSIREEFLVIFLSRAVRELAQ